jgi:hypothetical protein
MSGRRGKFSGSGAARLGITRPRLRIDAGQRLIAHKDCEKSYQVPTAVSHDNWAKSIGAPDEN